jgi:isopentenyl-diphosphate delta-isomerase
MRKVTSISARKADHIRINLDENVSSALNPGLNHYRFIHEALPEINLDEINTKVTIFNRQLNAPILISSMTGGTEEAGRINQNLAIAAQEMQIAMGLGSQRAAFDHPEITKTFQVRKWAPDILLFANLGAIQLNYDFGLEQCLKAVEMVEADALILHLNPLQEALQPGGNTHFKDLIHKIEIVCKNLSVPVIVKEVGWGISKTTALKLFDVGVQAIDVAGAGGTSWSQVEMHRAKDQYQARLAESFIDWGIPTAEAVIQVRQALPNALVFASGGIRNGIDIAKCIALGANLVGMANPFLKTAVISSDETISEIKLAHSELLLSMFAVGVESIPALQSTTLVKI